MEEKKFDPYQFTGVFLIALILTWMLFNNDNAQEASESNQMSNNSSEASNFETLPSNSGEDSVLNHDNDQLFGVFGRLMEDKKSEVQVLENENLYLSLIHI